VLRTYQQIINISNKDRTNNFQCPYNELCAVKDEMIICDMVVKAALVRMDKA
jgi:hypothetical protein